MESEPRPTNIVDRGAQRRRRMGIGWLIAGVVAAIVVIAMHLARDWCLLLIVPFAISANGFLQARDKTCVMLAALGKRELNDGRSYGDVAGEERTVLRRRALVILSQSALIALAITAAIWWMD